LARTLAVFSLPAALVLLAWLRLEDPQAGGADWLWVVLLALLPALAPTLWLRLALVPPAALIALWVMFDTPAPDDRRGFFEPVYHRFSDGLLDYYDVTVPFAGTDQPHMHGVLLLAVFGFCTLLAQAIAARRPLPAVLAVIGGAGWPAALYPSDNVAYGAIILGASLWVLAGLRSSPRVPALVGGAALVLVAAAASTTSAVAKDGILDWERWDPSGIVRVPVSVSYVWDANYGGIEFAEKPTTVLRVVGPERGFYWRATTLDEFDADRWLESTVVVSAGIADGPLPPDPLLPEAAANPSTWVRQDVEVLALNDTHLVGAAQPVRLVGPQFGETVFLSGGLARVRQLERGQRYTIWSYAPRPGPAELARLGADYPEELERFLDLGRTRAEPFGTPGREARMDAIFGDERYFALWPYREVWEQAKRLRADARTPYGAVVAIETWLRSTGGFRYDEQPRASGAGLPPLAWFVAEGKSGYCQHFAGAMALMLRMLGVPARVAAGFTSGKREDGGWTVTDHNAHAWVEAWFPGYGWLAFDPTPGRGSLTGDYSASSTGFNARDAAEAFGGGAAGGATTGGAQQLQLLERERLLALREAQAAQQDDGRSSLWLLLLLAVAAVAVIALAKLVRRRARYLTRDPRRIASAARHELADFLADQGIAVGASATPDELRELVRIELGRDAQGFADALAEARFGPPAASREAADLVRRELRTLLRSLRRSLGRSARVRGLLALRSLRV
jgi:transglutaminase-like putative cysteine protease